MLQEVEGARLLEGFRGQPAADVDALVHLLVRVPSRDAVEGEVRELDLNRSWSSRAWTGSETLMP
jgi:hypothetical protein